MCWIQKKRRESKVRVEARVEGGVGRGKWINHSVME